MASKDGELSDCSANSSQHLTEKKKKRMSHSQVLGTLPKSRLGEL